MKSPAPLLIALLALAGCSSPVNNSSTPINPPPLSPAAPPPLRQAPQTDPRILIHSSLSSALRVVNAQSMTGAAGYLKIQVDVENQSDGPVRFIYSVEWLDADGTVLPMAGNGYLDWMLRAHETSSIAATAPTPAAKNFRIVFLSPSK
jgi:uncharacterized protein YcfL